MGRLEENEDSSQKNEGKCDENEECREMNLADDEVDDETVERAFRTAEKGTELRQVKLRFLRSPSFLRLSSDHTTLIYKPPGGQLRRILKQNRSKRVPLTMLIDVRSGWNTDRFMKAATRQDFVDSVSETCCFSVIFRKLHHLQKSVDFVTETSEEQKSWLVALRRLLNNIREAGLHFDEENWLKKHFRSADTDHNGKLSFSELWELLNKLGVQISKNECKKQFQESDIRKSNAEDAGFLDFEEFVLFFRSLTKRPELVKIMKKYSAQGIELWTAEDLKNFLEKSKRMQIETDKCKALIQEYEPDEIVKKDGNMSVHGKE